MHPPASHYVHGTSPPEQRRLSLLNEILNELSLRELHLCDGEKVLDVGCGLAQLSRAMARAGTGIQVIGVERSLEQLGEAARLAEAAGEQGLIDLRRGDALSLPLHADEWGSFDCVHARFLLEHVPDPLEVVRGMVRAARPGGRIVLEDDDHAVMRLWPEPLGFGPLWQAYLRSYDRLGNDPFVGRRLVSLLHDAEASPTRNTWLFFGSCSGDAMFVAYIENLRGILEGVRDTLISAQLLDPSSIDDALAALQAWSQRRDAAFWYAVAWAQGQRCC